MAAHEFLLVSAEGIAMHLIVPLPENLPMAMPNSIIQFVIVCLFVFGLMAFARFHGRARAEAAPSLNSAALAAP